MKWEQQLNLVWETDRMQDEALTMVQAEDGEISATLLFEPEEILYVKNACLTETYEEGRDYILQGRKMIATPNSRMFYFTQEQLFGNGFPEENHFKRDDGRPHLHAEGTFFHERQITVTYTCKKKWTGFIPPFQGQNLPKTMEKLKNGGKFHLVLFGDSISAGCNASGLRNGAPPYLPIWGELVADSLRAHYKKADISFFNPSVGGKCSKWALENAKELVNTCQPDLVILAFGMNGGYEPAVFQAHMQKIMEIVRADAPDCEFVLVATSVPNPVLTNPENPFWKYQAEYKHVLEPLCETGTVMVNITDVHQYLIERKSFIDLTGNHVNHPNDFLVRVYAQCLNTTLIERG